MLGGASKIYLRGNDFQCIPVVSPNPGLDVDVLHLYNGMISSTSSPSSLAASIIQLVNNKNLYNKIKIGCKEYTEEISNDYLK